jgi:tetratricopeptide (TPR) repeat protein
MKSDHRHELKTNELADWMAHFPEWARANRTSLIAAAAVVLVALLVYFWSFYRRDVASVRQQARLTELVGQVPQQVNRIARAAMQGQDESYLLLESQQQLQDFAQKSSDNNMAALALIQRGEALRAELHYRLSEVSRDELVKQIGQAQASYQQALDRRPSNPSLAAAAQYGLGLCEEELGNFDKAREIYSAVADKPEYAGTTGQAAAAYRLKIMDDYRTEVVFAPAPPKPTEPPTPVIQIQPGEPAAPMIGPALPPQEQNAEPTAPAAETPAPTTTPGTSDTNTPQGG